MEVDICSLPTGQDPDEFVRKSGPSALTALLEKSPSLIDFKLANFPAQAKSATDRARAARELLDVVSRITDDIQRSYVIRELAEKLNLEESLLWREIGGGKTRPRAPARTVETAHPAIEFFKSRRGAAELGLIEVALGRSDLIPKIAAHLQAEELRHPEIRELFTRWLARKQGDPEDHDAGRAIASLRDPEIARSVSEALTSRKLAKNAWQYAVDCLVALKCAIIDETIAALRENLRRESTPALLAEIQRLQQEKKIVARGELGVRDDPPK